MGRYRKIEVRVWADEKFRSLSPLQPSGQALWLYLLTGPHTNSIPGLFVSGKAALCEALNWESEAFGKAFQEVLDQGMIQYDHSSRLVWVPNAIKYNPPESPNVIKSWSGYAREIPECEIFSIAVSSMRETIYTMNEAFGKAFDEAFPKAFLKPSPKPSRKTMPNQEQEQEHKQEKKEKTPIVPFSASEKISPEDFAPDSEPSQTTKRRYTDREVNAFFARWNDSGLPEYRKLLINIPNAGELLEALSFYTPDEIEYAIDAYSTIQQDENYGVTFHYANVVNFLIKGLECFAPGAKPFEVYKPKQGVNGQSGKSELDKAFEIMAERERKGATV